MSGETPGPTHPNSPADPEFDERDLQAAEYVLGALPRNHFVVFAFRDGGNQTGSRTSRGLGLMRRPFDERYFRWIACISPFATALRG